MQQTKTSLFACMMLCLKDCSNQKMHVMLQRRASEKSVSHHCTCTPLNVQAAHSSMGCMCTSSPSGYTPRKILSGVHPQHALTFYKIHRVLLLWGATTQHGHTPTEFVCTNLAIYWATKISSKQQPCILEKLCLSTTQLMSLWHHCAK